MGGERGEVTGGEGGMGGGVARGMENLRLPFSLFLSPLLSLSACLALPLFVSLTPLGWQDCAAILQSLDEGNGLQHAVSGTLNLNMHIRVSTEWNPLYVEVRPCWSPLPLLLAPASSLHTQAFYFEVETW